MKIKRFFSSDMRSVIRMVREELGADAVILSNSRVNGGVEVVAAVDYDETIFADNQSGSETSQKTTSDKNTVPETLVTPDSHEVRETGKTHAAESTARTPAKIRENENGFAALRQADPIDPLLKQTENQTDTRQPASATKKQTTSGSDHSKQLRQERQQRKQAVSNEYDDLSEQQKKDSDFSFYLLGDEDVGEDSYNEESSVEGSLFDTANPEVDFSTSSITPVFDNETGNNAGNNSTSTSVWSQEPTLVEMRKDIQALRGLLEQQLTGLAWGDLARKNPVRAKLIRHLLELDISPPLAGKIADAAAKHSSFEKAWQVALNLLTHNLPTISDDMITDGGIVALVGPTGVGKTTTVAKLAARYALRHGRNRVALVTTDCYRIAAHEQLRTYGRILGMPVRIATDKNELVETLKSFSDKDLVLIDTAGMSHRDMRLVEQFSMITDSAPSIKSLLVMSATTHRSGLDEIVKVFRNVDLDGCVLTKVDETTGLAGALSVAIEHRLPVAYVGNGQKVPEDLHLARAHSLVNQSVLVARKTNQPMTDESLELAFSRVKSNACV